MTVADWQWAIDLARSIGCHNAADLMESARAEPTIDDLLTPVCPAGPHEHWTYERDGYRSPFFWPSEEAARAQAEAAAASCHPPKGPVTVLRGECPRPLALRRRGWGGRSQRW